MLLIPASTMKDYADEGRLGRTPREGDLDHYYVVFTDAKSKFEWMMREAREKKRRGSSIQIVRLSFEEDRTVVCRKSVCH